MLTVSCRVILGKSNSGGGEHHPLDTINILHAIRSFALMKQELIEFRKQQEVKEGDPPSILQTLGSPGTSDATTNGASTPRTAASAAPSPRMNGFAAGLETQVERPDETPTRPNLSVALELVEAKRQIEILEQQLSAANETILELQTEKILGRGRRSNSGGGEAANMDSSLLVHETPAECDLNLMYERLLLEHKSSVEESKRNLDMVLEEVASVPRRVLAKDSVREKLKVYVQTVAHHTSNLQHIELQAQLQKSQEDSGARIQALQEQLQRQEDTYHQQLALLKGKNGPSTMNDAIRQSMASVSEGSENKHSSNSLMNELQARLFASQAEAETLTQQIQDLEVGLGLGNGCRTKTVESILPKHLILKEFSQNLNSRMPVATTRKREMEDEKKIDG
jgi:hypothetical protein